MITKHDILTDEGGRLLTCIRNGDRVILQGKEGFLSMEGLISQIITPITTKHNKK